MPRIIQKHRSAFGGKVAPFASNLNWRAWPALLKPEAMLKLAYALHKLRVKHATR